MPKTNFKFKIKNLKFGNGFTLVELLLVIAILGILSSIVSYSMIARQKSARDAQRKNDMQVFKKAMESAKADCRSAAYYPRPSASGVEEQRFSQTASTYLANANLKYLPNVLIDPKNGLTYTYRLAWTPTAGNHCTAATGATLTQPSTETWVARARLEMGSNDPDRLTSYNKCSSKISTIGTNGFESGLYPSNTDDFYYVCSD